jgi:FdhD protein
MWLERISGEGKLLYTTGRLTSEIVMKAAWMGISVIRSLSRFSERAMLILSGRGEPS